MRKPLAAARVALLSTAGLSMKGDSPFDMEMERRNPTRGDGSWRAIPADATTGSVVANHLHIDTGYIDRDLNVALPLDRLRELRAAGEVGELRPITRSWATRATIRVSWWRRVPRPSPTR